VSLLLEYGLDIHSHLKTLERRTK
jgi:hypothetical protein